MSREPGTSVEERSDGAKRHAVDFSRLEGQLDITVLKRTRIAVAGLGVGSSYVRNMARSGIGSFIIVDPDSVDRTNVATQAYSAEEIGLPKAQALAAELRRINPDIDVAAFACRIEDLPEEAATSFWQADLIIAGTDAFEAQCYMNRKAVESGTDTLFPGCYASCAGVELVGTFADVIAAGRGCWTCHTWRRHEAFAAGRTKEAPFYARHPWIGELANLQAGYHSVSLLHLRAGSQLPITRIAERFLTSPLLITRIDPGFYAGDNEMFSDLPEGYGALLSRHWGRDVPLGFVCPDCGSPSPESLHGSSPHQAANWSAVTQQRESPA
ncbi:MAG: ThiF family adenylyltransferase [Gammaproteobacteria bacterium]